MPIPVQLMFIQVYNDLVFTIHCSLLIDDLRSHTVFACYNTCWSLSLPATTLAGLTPAQ